MKKIITYGTFDLFHEGHLRLLQRAKQLGDYLIVGVTSDQYDEGRGKLNVQQNLIQRIENIKNTGLADEIIVEEYEGQKIHDIQKYGVHTFAIGSDWIGKFDYLRKYCAVEYLERTRGVSSTQLRSIKTGIIRLGIVGYGRIAERFIGESKFVSGINVDSVFGPNIEKARSFMDKHSLQGCTSSYTELLDRSDAVYIASPHDTHFNYVLSALNMGKHVLCEKPLGLKSKEVKLLFQEAKKNNVVLVEGIKTAYCPAFNQLVGVVNSGAIGQVVDIKASFTRLIPQGGREYDAQKSGGSITEYASYVLLAAIKLLGCESNTYTFFSFIDKSTNVDIFTKIEMRSPLATATLTVGIGAKTEGDLVISGTEGYIYVPAPWWKTDYFEIRYEDPNRRQRYFRKFDGEGLRYELAEFTKMIWNNELESHRLLHEESIEIAGAIEQFLNGTNTIKKII